MSEAFLWNHQTRMDAIEREARMQGTRVLRGRLLVVAVLLTVFTFMVSVTFLLSGVPLEAWVANTGLLLLLVLVNFLFYFRPHYFGDLKLATYITTLGLYLLAIGMVSVFENPGMFAVLFLVYAVISIYQELRTSVLNGATLFVVGTVLLFYFPEVFGGAAGWSPDTLYLFAFLVIFVFLLTAAFLILLKRRRRVFFTSAAVKEEQFNTFELFLSMLPPGRIDKEAAKKYYEDVERFAKAFSSEVDVPDVFSDKLQWLRRLDLKDTEAAKGTSTLSHDEVPELHQLLLKRIRKMYYVALKASQQETIRPKSRRFDLQDETSLPALASDEEVSLVTFAVFVTALSFPKPVHKGLTVEQILNILTSDPFLNPLPEEMLELLKQNKQRIQSIIDDELRGEGST